MSDLLRLLHSKSAVILKEDSQAAGWHFRVPSSILGLFYGETEMNQVPVQYELSLQIISC